MMVKSLKPDETREGNVKNLSPSKLGRDREGGLSVGDREEKRWPKRNELGLILLSERK